MKVQPNRAKAIAARHSVRGRTAVFVLVADTTVEPWIVEVGWTGPADELDRLLEKVRQAYLAERARKGAAVTS